MIERRRRAKGVVTWRVRYRDPTGHQRSQSFSHKRDAEEFQRRVREEMNQGRWVDPQRGTLRLNELWPEFERAAMTHLRLTTQQNYRAAWRNIEPAFGAWPVARITRREVTDWIEALSATKGPETVRAAHRVLCLILDHGVAEHRVHANAARGVKLPRRSAPRERILDVVQVEALAERLGDDGDLVLAMAFLGLRWSELAALKAQDVDLARRRVRVVERATEVGGRMDVSEPKSKASRRSVAIPEFLVEILERRTAGQVSDALVFASPEGGYLRNGNWKRATRWSAVTTELGMAGITPHDLRRTFGSLARAAGADLRWIQKAMGHESITTTARIYAHLYDDELDIVAQAMDRMSVARRQR